MATPLRELNAPESIREPREGVTLREAGPAHGGRVLHQALLVAEKLNLVRSSDPMERLGPTLAASNVDVLPHQVEAALFALSAPFERGVILADEVGLGKTIEAGLVVAQLLSNSAIITIMNAPVLHIAQYPQRGYTPIHNACNQKNEPVRNE